MTARPVDIVPCPPTLTGAAIALALRDIAPEQRCEIVPNPVAGVPSAPIAIDGLVVALRDGELCGAAWGQRQPGNAAVLWPPQITEDIGPDVAERLILAAIAALDADGVSLTQVLLTDRVAAIIPALCAGGFHYLANLLYLTWECAPNLGGPPVPQSTAPLEYMPFTEPQRRRLMELLERTYEGTQDCAAMNGRRAMNDLIDGYQATGLYRPSNWLFALAGGEDVGVLLLADHPSAGHWELMYMGLVPKARGRGWGHAIVRHAQALASRASVERIVLAVDSANHPALAMYRDAGFVAWDERSVFVRFGSAI